MLWIQPSVIATLSATILLTLVYWYLYNQDRKRYLLIWMVSWTSYSVRFIFILVLLQNPDSLVLTFGNQAIALVSGWLLIWGGYEFVGKPISRWWGIATVVGVLWVMVSHVTEAAFVIMAAPTFTLLAAIYIWTGIIFTRISDIEGIGPKLTGWVFILWGIHKIDYPFLSPVEWFAPWSYLIGAVFALAVAMGMILIYFQKARQETARSESRFRLLFNRGNDIIFVNQMDEQGRLTKFIDVNDVACEQLEFAEQELLSLLPQEIFLPAEQDSTKVGFEKLQIQEHVLFETVLLTKRGQKVPVEVNAHLFDLDGKQTILSIARDLTERKQELKKLMSLRTIDKAISSSLDIEATLDVVLDQILDRFDVPAADIYLYEGTANILTYATGCGFSKRYPSQTALLLGDGYTGRVALDRKTMFIPDLAKKNSDDGFEIVWKDEVFISYIGMPLFAKDEVNGVLQIYNRQRLEPGLDWWHFLETVAEQAAIAINNSTLFDSLQSSNRELIASYDTTLEGWAKTLELRDHDTEGHSRRVTEMTLELAQEMGIPEEEIIHVMRGSLLHDIGKMGIPDSILRKTGKLTLEEWDIMKKHPVFAYDLLYPIPYLRPALEIPYCHHEKWNGDGYPRGLKDEEIPLAARVFAVVDVYDALVSDRPYRDAWPKGKAIAYLKEEARKHFDPKVVEAFLVLIGQC